MTPSENNKWRRGKFLEFKPNEWIGKFGFEQVKINSFSTLTESKVSTGLGNIAPSDSEVIRWSSSRELSRYETIPIDFWDA